MFILMLIFCLNSGIASEIDLHNHAFMKPGVGPLLWGDANHPAEATSWSDRFSSHSGTVELNNSSAPLIVISFYAHPWLTRFHVEEALEKEWQQFQNWLQSQTRFVLANNAKEAHAILKNGKQVVVLSLEGAYPALKNIETYNLWVKERKLSIVTVFHITDDDFGGGAFMKPLYAAFANPYSFFTSLMLSGWSCLKTTCYNPFGATVLGESLVQQLIQDKVWIDFSHVTRQAFRQIVTDEFPQPILFTHTAPLSIYRTERALLPEQVEAIQKHDGIVGFLPSIDMMYPKPHPKCLAYEAALAAINELKQALGAKRVTLGSDSNAPMRGIPAPCDAKPDLHEYANFGEWESVSNSLIGSDHSATLDQFLSLWGKVR